jgi:hypothetical protein
MYFDNLAMQVLHESGQHKNDAKAMHPMQHLQNSTLNGRRIWAKILIQAGRGTLQHESGLLHFVRMYTGQRNGPVGSNTHPGIDHQLAKDIQFRGSSAIATVSRYATATFPCWHCPHFHLSQLETAAAAPLSHCPHLFLHHLPLPGFCKCDHCL